MTDRRRASRYSLGRTTPARVGVLQDVLIHSSNGNEVTVLSPVLPPRCDRMLMQVVGTSGAMVSLSARILSTAPVLENGVLQFLVELQVDGFAEALSVGSLLG